MAAAAQEGDKDRGSNITIVSLAGPALVVPCVPLHPGCLYSSSSSAVHPELSLSGTSQLVPNVAIDVPRSIQVSRSSGPQDGNNNGNRKWTAAFLAFLFVVANWMTGTIARLNKPALLAVVLFVADCTSGTIALLKKPPGSSAAWYIVADAAIFTAGMLEGLAIVLISCNARKYGTFGRVIHLISIGAIILGVVLEVIDYKVKK